MDRIIQGRCRAILGRAILLSTVATFLIILSAGCATAPEADAARAQRRFELAAATLERKTDSDSLAAAALLRYWAKESDLAVGLLARATEAAPERADLAWLGIRICREVLTCDPTPEEARLRALDPSNGAGWLNALARATASDDEAARIAVLAELARTERVDLYWTTLVLHLTQAIADTQKVSLREAFLVVVGLLAATDVPAYTATSNLCRGERLKSQSINNDCRAVALAFERGDTYITELMGVAMAKHLWPIDSPEWKDAAEARRVYEYRSRLWTRLELRSLRKRRWTEEYLALCAQNRREQDVQRAGLVNHGRSPDPPPT